MRGANYQEGLQDGKAGKPPDPDRLNLGGNHLNDYEHGYIDSGKALPARTATPPPEPTSKPGSEPGPPGNVAATGMHLTPQARNGDSPMPPDWRAIAAALAWSMTGNRHSRAEQAALDRYDRAVKWEQRHGGD